MKIVTGIVLLSLVFFFSGCTTKEETSEIKTQLTSLQDLLSQEKQRVIELEYKIETLSSELQSLKGIAVYEEKPKVTPDDFTKKVQLALATAGFNPGKADGKMGHQTIQAIKDFQEANGLEVDGVVDKETWEKLQRSLMDVLK